MSGEKQSSTFLEKLTKVDQRIDELYNSYNINREIFNIDVNTLSKEDCESKAVYLINLAYHLQLECNRLKSKLNFSQTILNRYVYPLTVNYKGSWDSTFYSVISNDNYAISVHNEIIKIQVDLNAIDYISKRLDTMAEMLYNIARGKK